MSPEERRMAIENLYQVLDPKMVRLLEQRSIKRREAVERCVNEQLDAEAAEALGAMRVQSEGEGGCKERRAATTPAPPKHAAAADADGELPARLRDLAEEFRKPSGSVWALLASGKGPWIHQVHTHTHARTHTHTHVGQGHALIRW